MPKARRGGREKTKVEKTGNRGRSKSKKKKEKKEGCFECGSVDHWKRNCKIWKEKKAKREGSSGSASAVTEHESDGELLSVTSGSKAFTNWILDTGCTFHMCAVREWFDTYKKVSNGEVLMGDDSSCPVKGIGTVQIRMFDGMIRVLGNIRYVPRLRKNLISLGTLDEAGYGYESKKRRVRVAKGSLVVMRGDLQPNKLYKLIGTTIVRGATVSVNQGIEDKTELWHHRLRHISQKGLQELHKQGMLEGVSSCKLDFCEYCVLGKQRKGGLGLFHEAEIRGFCKVQGMENRNRESNWKKDQSAEEVWSEKPVDYSKLRLFGCSAYAHNPSDERSKLKPKSTHCIFLGFEKVVKGFKLWDINNRKKVVSRDVVFDETTMPLNKVEKIEQDAESDGFEEEEEHQHRSPVRNQVEQEIGLIEGTPIRQTSQGVRTPTNNPPAFQRCITLDKPNRDKKKPDRFGFNQDKVNYALNISQGDPTTYREAIASDE
ncbi:hypothetical protein GBA52_015873 [Prunus armeniaca]|nr:hypothetical protein GBA52_015873 [Prunus armeniaca]